MFFVRKGATGLNGAALVQEQSGISHHVNIAVLIDQAPADGVVDIAAVVPLRFKVKRTVRGDGSVTEQGKGLAR